MNRLWLASLPGLALVSFPAAPLHAQGSVVEGAVVHGATHARIAGARVFIAGTDLAAVSAADGSYRINNVPAGDHAIESTAPGYQRGVAGCVRIPVAPNTGVAIPMLPEGYVAPPPPPARPTRAPAPAAQRPGAPQGPLLYVINDLVYPPGYEPPDMRSIGQSDRLESVEVFHAARAIQRYRPCAPVSGAVLLHYNLPGRSGRVVGSAVDAATDAPLSELRVGRDLGQSHVVHRGGGFDWYTSDSTTSLVLARYGYEPYVLPCRLRVPVDDSVTVLVRMSPTADASEGPLPTAATTFRELTDPLFVVNGTIWAPGTRGPLIPPDEIASIERLAPESARTRFGQCGAAGAVLVTTR